MKNRSCPVCSSSNIDQFIDISGMPVYCNRLWPTAKEAIAAPQGDIRLGYCEQCGHVFNTAFDPTLMDYNEEYDNSLHYSPVFQRYAESLAQRLIKDYDLHDKDVIEIGCGKGDFLSMLCDYGNNRGLGFDPSYEPDREPNTQSKNFRVIKDYYALPYKDHTAELICCRHVLEHIEHPCDFLNSVRQTIGDRTQSIVFFEVPDVMYTLKDMGVWDLIYEHCGYFTRKSLKHAFNVSGFQTLKLESVFEGQFLGIDAKPIQIVENIPEQLDPQENNYRDLVDNFSNDYQLKRSLWEEQLERIDAKGQNTIIWGGGSKGVTFLNAIAAARGIQYVVDINPHKQGKFVPCSGQEIVSPEYLSEYKPDVVLVMNPNYLSEIKEQCNAVNTNPEFIVV